MRASLATIPRPQGISSDAVCVSFSPSAFTFDTEPHNQLCNLASFDATLTPRTNSHAHEMYYQRFVGLSAQLCEKQGMLTSTSSSRRAATKSTAKALSLCGARCRGVWRSCAPELAPRCAAWCSLWGGILPLGESREPPQASRACTVKRARAKERDVSCTVAGSGARPHVLAKEWRSAVEFRPAQSVRTRPETEARETLAHSCSRARRL